MGCGNLLVVKGGHEILVDVIDNWVATIQFARICGAVTLSETAITIGSLRDTY